VQTHLQADPPNPRQHALGWVGRGCWNLGPPDFPGLIPATSTPMGNPVAFILKLTLPTWLRGQDLGYYNDMGPNVPRRLTSYHFARGSGNNPGTLSIIYQTSDLFTAKPCRWERE